MIIFFGGAEIIIAIVLFIAMISSSLKSLVGLLNVFWVLFAVSNLIQTVGIGYFHNRNSLKSTLSVLGIDAIRMALFFSTLKQIGAQILSQSGLGYIFSLCVFCVYFIIFCSAFGFGEVCTFIHATQNDKDVPLKLSLAGLAMVAVVAVIGRVL